MILFAHHAEPAPAVRVAGIPREALNRLARAVGHFGSDCAEILQSRQRRRRPASGEEEKCEAGDRERGAHQCDCAPNVRASQGERTAR